jgi:tetratricopeptide (TPR) repeat protein/uncharacterized protein Smg (DUF494 family)
MAKVPLRIYNKEIDALIDQGHVDEAIPHCQHILKAYPKHLETYRLLGKAYLEAQRYAEAADIFQRVLLAVPDDFVSHLGMSVICDEQKNLDAAIWHMERAFEVQPSNQGVVGELRRLYGRRDGLEPPKIRLTRGALAQMYAKGEQYPQAIAEIRSVLAEEPDRADLQLLLARSYFQSGQKVEATELCNTLLKRYPYVLDANRILVQILPGTSKAESAGAYRTRVSALDPYAAVITGSVFTSSDAPDNAVIVERLEYDAHSAAPSTPQLGWGASAQSQSQPSLESSYTNSAAPAENSAIPDWMKSSGWGDSTGAGTEEPIQFADEEPAAPASSELAQADIPDWLRSMAPPGSSAPATDSASFDISSTEADLDFLGSLNLPETSAPSQPAGQTRDESPDWLSGLGVAATGAAAAATNVPDWLQQPSSSQKNAPAPEPASSDLGDWLKSLDQPETPAAAPASDVPDWMKGLSDDQPAARPVMAESAPGTTASEQDDALAWLESLAAKQGAKPEELLTKPHERLDNAPDWVARVSDTPAVVRPPEPTQFIPEPPIEAEAQKTGPLSPKAAGPGITSSEQDDALAWLESLAAKQGAKPEEMVTKPADRRDDAPSWVAQVQNPPTDLSARVSGPGTSASEQDDALAWLESLAAKQGAKPEEMVSKPADRRDDAPDWVGKVSAAPAPQQPAESELSSLISGPGTSASDQDDALAWLESLAAKQGVNPEELVTKPTDRRDNAPDWINQVAQEPPVKAPPAEKDETLEWLTSLETPAGAPAPEEKQPGWMSFAAPEQPQSQPETDISAWLKSLDDADQKNEDRQPDRAEMDTSEEAASIAAAEPEMPSWIKTMNEPASTPISQDDLPDWLKDQAADEAKPEPKTISSEWIPAEAAVDRSAAPEIESILEPEPPLTAPSSLSFEVPPPRPESSAPRPRPSSVPGDREAPILEKAQIELAKNNLDDAMQEFSKLIKKGKLLEEVIYDLREATYRHPVDVIVWQTLGDAYMRSNRLQDALDAYTKAEELLR